ncbi:Na+/H+ antiporter NhaA [Kribbia dieselivorans]|uniref:Na+/H+ antiporter NhaA n=1 Tax=Kribbia dieselivorans TaxID=331526 RepID=UPI000838B57C|nr:Na+/H+ antiporter NhaA [Kribbia dieselivorans]
MTPTSPTDPHATEPHETQPRLSIGRATYREFVRIETLLRQETVGGFLLVSAALIALIWANTPWTDAYFTLRDTEVGYAPWHLRLSLGSWAADGLLAIFFFLVGLELKREIVAGDLRQFDRAIVPVAAAAGGVIVPALTFAAINVTHPEALRGWATPTATDIAFAVAVLAIVGSRLPAAFRIFLLTLAVVDDLIAIIIIAAVYTTDLNLTMLAWSIVPLVAYAIVARRGRRFLRQSWTRAWIVLLPIGAVFWALIHASGIHATIAGVVLGFVVPVRVRLDRGEPHDAPGLAEVFEHRLRPLSAGFAVPVFAFFAAGVTVGGWAGLSSALTSTVTLGIIVGLVVGKPIGIVGTTWLLTKLTRSSLDPSITWVDLFGMGVLTGIGFTVSLLVAELSFGIGTALGDHAKVGILLASLLAAVAGSLLLGARNRHYRALGVSNAPAPPVT